MEWLRKACLCWSVTVLPGAVCVCVQSVLCVCVCVCVSVLIGENCWSPGLGLTGEETDRWEHDPFLNHRAWQWLSWDQDLAFLVLGPVPFDRMCCLD